MCLVAFMDSNLYTKVPLALNTKVSLPGNNPSNLLFTLNNLRALFSVSANKIKGRL